MSTTTMRWDEMSEELQNAVQVVASEAEREAAFIAAGSPASRSTTVEFVIKALGLDDYETLVPATDRAVIEAVWERALVTDATTAITELE